MLKKILVALGVIVLGLMATATIAAAEAIGPSATIVDVSAGARLSISPVILAVLAGTILPILNGIVLRTTASSGLSAFVNLVGVALVTVANFVLTSPVFDVSTVVILAGSTFAMSIASYYGFWKPIDSGGGRAPLNGTLGFVGPKPRA